MFESVSIYGFFGAQGHVTPKWLIRCGRKSNSSEILCLSWLSASLAKIGLKMNVLALETPFTHFRSMGVFRRSRASNSEGCCPPGRNSNPSEILWKSLLPASLKTNLIKNNREKMEALAWSHRFPHYTRKSMGAFFCYGNHSFNGICSKT